MGLWSIPLHGTPAPQQNFADSFQAGQISALTQQQMLKNQDLTEQQTQAADTENKIRAQALKDSQALKQAFVETSSEPTKFRQRATELGASPTAIMGIDQHNAQMNHVLAQTETAKLALQGQKDERVRGALMGIKGLDPEKKAQAWAPTINDLVQKGMLDPDKGKAALEQWPDGPDDEDLDLRIHGLTSGLTWNKEEMARRALAVKEQVANTGATRANASADLTDARIPEIQAKTEAQQRSNLGGRLAAATTAEDYEREYDQIKDDNPLKKSLPRPWEWNEDTPEAVRRWGMSPKEQSSADAAQERADALAEHRKTQTQQVWARINSKNSQTKNSTAVDLRKAQADFSKATEEENKLHELRRRLGDAITSGKSYIDRLGNKIPMDKATAQGETAPDLVQDMKTRYQGATERLRPALTRKYDAGEKLGMQPKISLDQVLGAVDAGDEALFGSKTATATPAAPAGQQAAPPPAAAPAVPAAAPVAPKPAAAQPRPATPSTPKMIRMKAPNGQIAAVSPDQVEHYKQKGAVIVQ